jgi:hypothetical protein
MSKRSGIILAFLYTDCSAIRKQHLALCPAAGLFCEQAKNLYAN